MDRWVDGWVDPWMDGWMDGIGWDLRWMDRNPWSAGPHAPFDTLIWNLRTWSKIYPNTSLEHKNWHVLAPLFEPKRNTWKSGPTVGTSEGTKTDFMREVNVVWQNPGMDCGCWICHSTCRQNDGTVQMGGVVIGGSSHGCKRVIGFLFLHIYIYRVCIRYMEMNDRVRLGGWDELAMYS